jgi:hypothetical protein
MKMEITPEASNSCIIKIPNGPGDKDFVLAQLYIYKDELQVIVKTGDGSRDKSLSSVAIQANGVVRVIDAKDILVYDKKQVHLVGSDHD